MELIAALPGGYELHGDRSMCSPQLRVCGGGPVSFGSVCSDRQRAASIVTRLVRLEGIARMAGDRPAIEICLRARRAIEDVLIAISYEERGLKCPSR